MPLPSVLQHFSISFFAYRAVAWGTATMQLFTRWMWTDASWLNQSRLIYVNAVIVKSLECNVFKKTNSFYDVIKGRSSSTCGPREISTSFPGNLHFFKPCPQVSHFALSHLLNVGSSPTQGFHFWNVWIPFQCCFLCRHLKSIGHTLDSKRFDWISFLIPEGLIFYCPISVTF